MTNVFIWPLKAIRIAEGILCIFDVLEPVVSDEEWILDVRFEGDEWVVIALGIYCVPVSLLNVDTSTGLNLYLAGSAPDQLEALVFGTIPLDVRSLAKIGLLIEMGAPTEEEHPLEVAA